MSAAQERSYESRINWCVEAVQQPLDIKLLFGNSQPVVCEIGFGMGSATAELAARNPDINYLGIEVYKAGIGRLIWEIENLGLKNIRIIEGDAAEVLKDTISGSQFEGFHVFFPDPWPKKRHHKRRLMHRPFTELLAERLKASGYVYMVTDWEDYALDALAELEASAGLCNAYSGFAEPLAWRPATKFERKGRAAEHKIYELYFVKSGGVFADMESE
ncbi:MAG: tRNA (guanosine(46)-N7)-methyltransferase TrmB [Spirochaetaceae bacterium]|jgi:tRNA (guanine-N7-)-methyltransferase|nr:tRNA (guanosine(46)-N7)-methyltransferase TrmB [Spirochaetaceae bacterium]